MADTVGTALSAAAVRLDFAYPAMVASLSTFMVEGFEPLDFDEHEKTGDVCTYRGKGWWIGATLLEKSRVRS